MWHRRAWALLLALTAQEAWASTPAEADAAALPEVVVPLPPDDPPPETPSRRDPTAPVSVIDAKAARSQAKVASDVISEAPGIIVQDRGGLLQTRSLVVRGASSSGVRVLLDGIPLNGSGGMVDLSRIPLPIVDRFEVLRGGGSLYAAGALGGVVNVVTRKPTDGAVVSGNLTWGSFGTGLGNVSAAGALLGGHGLLVLHGARTEGGFSYLFDEQPTFEDNPLVERTRRNNDVALGGAMARFTRALTSQTSLDVMAEGLWDDRGLAGTSQNPTPDARQEAQRFTGAVRATRTFHAGEGAVRAWGKRDRSTFTGGTFGPAADQEEVGAGVELSGQWLFAEIHGLSASAEVAYDGLVERTGKNPNWLRAGAHLADELLLLDGRLSVVPAARVDQTGPFTTFAPKLGASFELPLGFTVRANVGQAHRAPSFQELYVIQGTLLPNANLRPERALFADATVEHRTQKTRVSVTGFTALYDDLIAYEYYPPFLARPYNFDTARVQGAEAEASIRPSRHVDARASYTLTFSKNLRDDPRFYLKEVPYRPRHRVVGQVTAGIERARARAEVDFQSAQYMNRTNTLELPARALVNVGATAQVWRGPDIALAADLKNVFDVQSSDFAGYPLPGRALYVTLSFSLEGKP